MKRCQSLHDPIIHSQIVQKTNSDREPDLSQHANTIVFLLWIDTHLSSENQEMKCSDLKHAKRNTTCVMCFLMNAPSLGSP